MNILVVGAGPVGLSCGLELARRGIKPTIVDKRDSASTLSRAVGITPKTLELLSNTNVSKRLIEEGIAVKKAWFYQGKKLVLEQPIMSQQSYYPHLVGLPQDRTEAILAEELASMDCAVNYHQQLISVKQIHDKLEVCFANGKESVFDVVIGADGIKSTVRQQAQIDYPGYDLPETWSIADVELNQWQHPHDFCLFITDSIAVVVPIGPSRYRIVSNTENALESVSLPLTVDTIHRQGTFTISVRQATTYSKGNIHLAGDAAHCHSPVGGRGMNMGIVDAVFLAQCLADNDLQSYSEVRHKVAKQTIAMTERGRKMMTSKNPMKQFFVTSMLATINKLNPLKQRVAKFIVEA